MKKYVSSLVLVIFLASSLALAAEKTAGQTVSLKIEGMTCGICSAKVKKQLTNLCKEVNVDWKKGEGTCSCEGSCDTQKILSEANKTGFKTTLKN